MNSAGNTSIDTASSSGSSVTETTKTVIPLDVRRLPSIWSSLTIELRKQLLIDLPVARAVMSSLHWMYHWTNTRDDQDLQNPYKRFPRRDYLFAMHKLFLREPILFIEKSRSMITSWWAAAEALHYVMTHQPSKALLWAQDQAPRGDAEGLCLGAVRTTGTNSERALPSSTSAAEPILRQA